ncbi:MAG: hypothetical protein E7485_05330 [Ruminococcaceae bacterium]|nr:hypothetical protein [Oscillospiraceae bacterium]
MKLLKLLSILTACTAAVSMAGCSFKTGTSKFSSIISSVSLSDDAVLAHPTGEGIDNADSLSISYADFKKEYLYKLKNYNATYGVTSDTQEEYDAVFDGIRLSIISYMVEEQITLDKAKEYGADVLTDEELDALEADYQANLKSQYEYFGTKADYGTLEEGVTISEEEKLKRGEEEFDKYLADCGLTKDDLLVWQRSAVIAKKLKEAVTKDIVIERNEAVDVLNDYIDSVKEIYASDPAEYENGSYSVLWVPEEARNIKHILIALEEKDSDEIMSLRKSGDIETADKLLQEKLAPLEEKANEVMAKLDGGADFDQLIQEYSADAAAAEVYPDGYMIIPDSKMYVEGFVKGAFMMDNIGDYVLASSDFGWHIMLYASDPEISQEVMDENIDYILETLVTSAKDEKYSQTVKQWLDEYDYEIDYKALNVEAPVQTEEASSAAES